MFSLTGQYALRALIHLAQNVDDWPIPGRIIAREAEIPGKYLSKVLGDLVRAGVLKSNRGIGGGFRLVNSPKQTWLFDVLMPFEQFQRHRCPFDCRRCEGEAPCLMHDRWKKVAETQFDFLKMTSVYDAAIQQKPKRAPRRRKNP